MIKEHSFTTYKLSLDFKHQKLQENVKTKTLRCNYATTTTVRTMNVPSEIKPYLVLGTAASRTSQYLQNNDITLVINATNNSSCSATCCVPQICIACVDKPDCQIDKHFEEVSLSIQQEREKGGKIFVHCIAGISRSVTLILAYLMRYEKMNLKDAYNLVKGKRVFVKPNEGFWKQLVAYEKELFGINTITMMKYQDKLLPSIYESMYNNMLTL